MAVFEINKDNLIYNVNHIKKRLHSGVKFCAMVKGDAYGHNVIVVSKIIEPFVDYFGVATIHEGIILRKQNIKKPILCVGKADIKQIKLASKNCIEITIENIKQLQEILKLNIKISVHLKIDTGMHRLGFYDISDYKKALSLIKANKNIVLKGVFTHFSSTTDENYTKQLNDFNKYIKLIPQNVIKHCSNSLASRYSFLQFDMVRVGLSLYGYGEKNLKKVLTIKSKVISIRKVLANDTIGYDNSYIVKKDTLIGTVFLGYYDGINRKLSNKGIVYINNKPYKIVGKICMDMFMIEVDNLVKVYDEVIVFDDADYWAKLCDTISYEILTNFKRGRMQFKIA